MKDKDILQQPKSRFPDRICANPNCINGGFFDAHRRNQIFCRPACRIIFHNDKRSMEDKTIYLPAKELKAIDKKLHRMYEKYADTKGHCSVRKEIFHYEGINVLMLIQEWQHKETGAKIKGYFRYGIELSSQNNDFYFIYKLK